MFSENSRFNLCIICISAKIMSKSDVKFITIYKIKYNFMKK